MDVVFLFQLILPFLNNLLKYSYSQSTPRPGCCFHTESETVSPGNASSPRVRKVWMLDLNTTFFINSVLIEADTNDTDSISVDIGTSSCDTFQDTACFVWCYTRHVVSHNGAYVTVNITCDVTNVKGRYVRVRQSRASELTLCHVTVVGRRPSTNNELKNYALRADCHRSLSIPLSFKAKYAVDGNRDGSLGKSSCSRSLLDTTRTHWWRVDLGRVRLVSNITIADAKDSPVNDRLTNFTVEVERRIGTNYERKKCLYFNGTAVTLMNLTCTVPIWGRYVNISKTGHSLTLCEVEVYSDKDENSPIFSPVASFGCESLNESEELAASLEILEGNSNASATTNDNKQLSAEENMDQQEIDYCTTCNCHFPLPKSVESVQQKVKETVKELKVPATEMSQQVRKKTSVPDQRLSSEAVGLICVATISSIFAVIVACDVCRLLHYLLHSRNKHLKA